MADRLELKVPDLGDFSDVEVIEVLVSPGDTVAVEDGLVHGRPVRHRPDGR